MQMKKSEMRRTMRDISGGMTSMGTLEDQLGPTKWVMCYLMYH
jgi:hypothetical protein